MSDNYTYIIRGLPQYANYQNPQFPTRHRAVGEKAILEAIHLTDLEIVVRERYSTDEANLIPEGTWVERKQETRS